MARYTTTVNTDWSPETAFDYLAEFSNAAEWDPGVDGARNLSPAPLARGTRFELEVRVAGRSTPLVYEAIELERPRLVVLRAQGRASSRSTGSPSSRSRAAAPPSPTTPTCGSRARCACSTRR